MAITYSISGGADAAKFNIDGASGALTFKKAPDYEKPTDPETGDANGDHVYEVQVKATDATGLSSTKDVKVTVTDVSEGSPPQITSAGAISVTENQTMVMTITATDPDDSGGGGGGALPALTASGSITVGSEKVIENKLVTGQIVVNGKDGVTIRNCQINHPGGVGIDATSCTNLTIEDVNINNTRAATGQSPNPDESKNIYLLYGGPFTVRRATLIGAGGFYCYKTTGKLTAQFIEGHKHRNTATIYRGQLIQMNQCSGGLLLEDFSTENPGDNSCTADNLSFYMGGANNIQIRRGLIQGNNDPAGCAIMMENGTSGALVEDVDCVNQGNGMFAAYDAGTKDNRYLRCRMRDQIMGDQGRGKPTSDGGAGPIVLIADPNTSGTRFESCRHYNINENNLAWVGSNMTVVDLVKENFTARAPIRNRKPGT